MTESRRILITGASGLIGRALVSRFLAENWRVVAQVRNKESLDPKQFENSKNLEILEFDFAQETGGELIARAGKLDFIINNAADQRVLQLNDRTGAIEQLTVNLIAPAEIAAAAKSAGVSALINISSIEGQSARAGHEYYGASKAGLDALTRSLAASLTPMRLLSIRLGLIGDDSLATRWPEGVSAWKKAVPAARYATPEEVADFALLLTSKSLDYATGAIFDFDGGKGASPGW